MLIVTGCREWGASLFRYFEKRDFAVRCCTTFREALRIAATARFDIAVVDFFIGKGNGGTLCDALTLQSAGDTSLIIISNRQSAAIEREVRAHAPAYYFVKPCSFENLHAVALRICSEWEKRKLLATPQGKPSRTCREAGRRRLLRLEIPENQTAGVPRTAELTRKNNFRLLAKVQ
jgi:DNA-binding response OmpR family regulator